jgi:hypothetical protein
MTHVAAVVALIGLAGCGARSTATLGDDNLPPIVVLGGSIHFDSNEGWTPPQGNSGHWRQNSKQPGAPVGFRVVQNNSECLPRRAGILEITYREQGGTVRTFELLPAGQHVFLNPNGLQLVQENGGRRLTYPPAGTAEVIRFKGQATPNCRLADGSAEVIAQKN